MPLQMHMIGMIYQMYIANYVLCWKSPLKYLTLQDCEYAGGNLDFNKKQPKSIAGDRAKLERLHMLITS